MWRLVKHLDWDVVSSAYVTTYFVIQINVYVCNTCRQYTYLNELLNHLPDPECAPLDTGGPMKQSNSPVSFDLTLDFG